MKTKFVLISVLLFFLTLSLVLRKVGFTFLSANSPVLANILVVEGWIPEIGLQKAYEEFEKGGYDLILTTGSLLSDHITLFVNSFLIFYLPEAFKADSSKSIHDFELKVFSSLGSKDSAHFVFWVNDQRIAQHYTTANKGFFQVQWDGRLCEIDSLMIQFTNDKVSKKGDRNLIIRALVLNGSNIMKEHSGLFFDFGRPFGWQRRNFTAVSHAEMAANFFTDQGVDPKKVISVTNYYTHLRRTYGNALSLKEWLRKSSFEIKGFNVVSMDYHSRRTWLTYNKLLDDFGRVGIISVKNPDVALSKRLLLKKVFLELVALVYYYLFVLPWI